MKRPSWFRGDEQCPECEHVCFDHAACSVDGDGPVDPPCICANDAHFSGRIAA